MATQQKWWYLEIPDLLPEAFEHPDWHKQFVRLLSQDRQADDFVRDVKRKGAAHGVNADAAEFLLFRLLEQCVFQSCKASRLGGWANEKFFRTIEIQLTDIRNARDLVRNPVDLCSKNPGVFPVDEELVRLHLQFDKVEEALNAEKRTRLVDLQLSEKAWDTKALVRLCGAAQLIGHLSKIPYTQLSNLFNVAMRAAKLRTVSYSNFIKRIDRFKVDYPEIWDGILEELIMQEMRGVLPDNWFEIEPEQLCLGDSVP